MVRGRIGVVPNRQTNVWSPTQGMSHTAVGSPLRCGKNILTATCSLHYIDLAAVGNRYEAPPI